MAVDLLRAADLYALAASKFGHFDAILALGTMRLAGSGVLRSASLACEYLAASAGIGPWSQWLRRGVDHYFAALETYGSGGGGTRSGGGSSISSGGGGGYFSFSFDPVSSATPTPYVSFGHLVYNAFEGFCASVRHLITLKGAGAGAGSWIGSANEGEGEGEGESKGEGEGRGEGEDEIKDKGEEESKDKGRLINRNRISSDESTKEVYHVDDEGKEGDFAAAAMSSAKGITGERKGRGAEGQSDRQADRQADRQTVRQSGRQADRQSNSQSDSQSDRQTDRQADSQSDRQTDRQADSAALIEFAMGAPMAARSGTVRRCERSSVLAQC